MSGRWTAAVELGELAAQCYLQAHRLERCGQLQVLTGRHHHRRHMPGDGRQVRLPPHICMYVRCIPSTVARMTDIQASFRYLYCVLEPTTYMYVGTGLVGEFTRFRVHSTTRRLGGRPLKPGTTAGQRAKTGLTLTYRAAAIGGPRWMVGSS